MCAILFFVFTFLYLYCYQSELMVLTQHLCSGGQTHYDRTIGTVLILGVLMLLQFGIGRIFRRLDVVYAFSYIPSILFLAAITGIQIEDGGYTFGVFKIMLPVALTIYVLIVFALWKFSITTRYMYHFSMQTLAISNTLCMIAFFLFVCAFGNNSSSLHARIRAELCLMEGNYDDALSAIKSSGESSSEFTMLSAYALSCKGEMGEKMFTCNPTKGSHDLLPSAKNRLLMLPEEDIYKNLGPVTKQTLSASTYFDFILRHNLGKRHFADYLLISCLLDRDLDKFATYLPVFYDVERPLPMHYREALFLYSRTRTQPSIIYRSNTMEADFHDFQGMENKYKNKTERRNKLKGTYGNTYWFYYYYM